MIISWCGKLTNNFYKASEESVLLASIKRKQSIITTTFQGISRLPTPDLKIILASGGLK